MTALYLINGVAYGNLLFLMAAGFTLIFGVLRVINMAHGSFYLLGAYLAITVAEHGGGLLLGIVCGAVVAAALGAISERLLLYYLQGDYLGQVLVTIGILLIVGDGVLIFWGGTPQMLVVPPWLDFKISVGPLLYPGDRLLLIAIGPVVALALWYLTERTLIGARIRSAVDDEEIAQAVGINVPRLRVVVFALGSLLAGFSGAVGATFVGAKPGLDLEVILLALVIVVIGGPGSLLGSYIAAVTIGVIDSVGKSLLPEASLFLLFVPMLAVLIVRPAGLFGRVNSMPPVVTPPLSLTLTVPQALRSMWTAVVAHLRAVPLALRGGALLLVAVAMPWLAPDYTLGVISLALVWSIAAISLNIMMGYGGMPSLGHAAFFGVGAYVASAGGFLGMGGYTSIIIGSIIGGVAGAAMAIASLRARHAHLLLVTLAFGQVLWGIVFKWRSITGGDDGLIHSQRFEFPSVFGHTADLYFGIVVVFSVVMVIYLAFARSQFRLVLEGLRSNANRLLAFGYDVTKYRFGAFILAGILGAAAGGSYAIYAGFVSPDLFGINTSAKILLMTIVGGAGTFAGPIFGAFGLVGLEEILSGWTSRWMLVLGLIYILVAMAARIRIRFVPWHQPATVLPESRAARVADAP
jgi:branched-chain amino acid transport system permease protein